MVNIYGKNMPFVRAEKRETLSSLGKIRKLSLFPLKLLRPFYFLFKRLFLIF